MRCRSPSFLVLGVALVLLPGAALSQDYTIGFDGPESHSGAAGATVRGVYDWTLGHAGEGVGINGWSLGAVVDGGTIVSITTAGTKTEALFDSGLNQTAIAQGDVAGAYSFVVICRCGWVEIPPNETHAIVRTEVEFRIPEGGGEATMRFAPGLAEGARFEELMLSEEGLSVPFVREELTIALTETESCCDAPYRVGFSSSPLNNMTPGEGLIEDDPDLCHGVGAHEISSSDTIYVSNASNVPSPEDGIQGFSLSIEIVGDLNLTSATTDGTLAGPIEDGGLLSSGFSKASVFDPGHGGRRGAVAAVVFCFGDCDSVLNPIGTSSMLALTVEGERGGAGEIFFMDGLGRGQPVENIITVRGVSVPACNFDTARLSLSVRPGPATFVRGDANDDGKVNIADPIWILSDLFRMGPATSCLASADANNSLTVDLADVVFLINYSFRHGDAPADPFPGCGTIGDPEREAVSCDSAPSSCV